MQRTHRVRRVGVCWVALLFAALLIVRLPTRPAQAGTLARLVKDMNATKANFNPT